MKNKLLYTLLFAIVGSSSVLAQTPEATTPSSVPQMMTDPMNYIIVFMIVILFSVIIGLSKVIKNLTNQIAGPERVAESSTAASPVYVKRETFWSKFWKRMNDSVPVEKEADVLLDHDYDGIKELNNNLPPWWVYGFYITIIFAVFYLVNYHVIGKGNVQLDEYQAQLDEAAAQKQAHLKEVANNVDETSVTILTADADITAGKSTFLEKCSQCHGKSAEGNVGPNLTDDYWLHGGNIKDIFKTIKYGVTNKGMLAWQGQLTPVQMQQVASFIKSIKGSNPANPKAPQGDLYSENGAVSDTTKTAASDSTVKAVPDSTASASK